MLSSLSDRHIQKKVLATAQLGAGHSDGYLSVNSVTLHFEPFNQAYGLGPYLIPRDEISKVEPAYGKGGGFIPLIADAITITMADSRQYQFVLADAAGWIALLQPKS